MIKSPLAVKASLKVCYQPPVHEASDRHVNLPADPVLLHLPIGAFLTVEDLVRVINIPFQYTRHIPLSVVRLCRRRGDASAGQNFTCVGKDCLSPPFQLFILRWREAADEGACIPISIRPALLLGNRRHCLPISVVYP